MKSTRTAFMLKDSVHRRLNMYALAASAAGVGVLALAQPAEAKIIYTRTHVVIWPHGIHLYKLDLTHHGKTDFVLQSKRYSTTFVVAQKLFAAGASGNGLEDGAAPLTAGQSVGPHQQFQSRGLMASAWENTAQSFFYSGPWVNVNNGYLGLKFAIDGKTHYGWARLSVQVDQNALCLKATLTGYAYETIPYKAIIAGKTKGPDVITVGPATLGRLALGRK